MKVKSLKHFICLCFVSIMVTGVLFTPWKHNNVANSLCDDDVVVILPI